MRTEHSAFFAWVCVCDALALGVLMAWASSASAAEPRVALVIGNGGYRHVSRLANPPGDARAMAAALAEVGFEIVSGQPLVDADKLAMESAIRSFGRELRGGAVGLFYYAGHGVQARGQNYLLPVTANVAGESDVKYELVDAGFVLDEMANAGNRLNVVILDACRNNPFGDRGLRSASAGLAQVQAPAGTVIGYATQPGAVAEDGEGDHSPYTAALVEAIRHPGLRLFDTFNEVGLRVKRVTAGEQQPWLSTSPIEGQFYFVPGAVVDGAAPLTVPSAIELAFWTSAERTSTTASYEAYLAKYPRGSFADVAKAAVSKLTVVAVTPHPTPSPSLSPGPAASGERFRDQGDGTVLDTRTGLQWAARDNGSDIDWSSAKRYANSLTLGGHSDWGLPTEEDLSLLLQAAMPSTHSYRPACSKGSWLVDSPPGIRLSCRFLWASDTRGSEAANVDFNSGLLRFVRQADAYDARVLPVRVHE